MNWVSARCNRARPEAITTKRLPVKRVADSKSIMPRSAPRVTWSAGSKSNFRGVPQRRCSRLSSSLVPGGTLAWGIFGIPCSSCSRFTCTCLSSSSVARNSFPTEFMCSISGPVSSFEAFKRPMSLDLRLRSACNSCCRVCNAFRDWSRD